MIEIDRRALKERLTRFQGPFILPEPWIRPPRRSRLIDIVRIYDDLDQTVPIDPVAGYVVPDGHWFFLEGIALAANVMQVGYDSSGAGTVISHQNMWMDDRARIRCQINRQDIDPGGSAHKLRDTRAHLDRRDLGWKAYLNDITTLGNLSFAYPLYIPALPSLPAAWDTVTNPGTPPVFYNHTLRPRGTPTHGLQWIVPIRRLLGPGDEFRIILDLSDTDTLCTPAPPGLGVEMTTNGDLESWINPNNLTWWWEYTVAAGTVTQDPAFFQGGANSALLSVDNVGGTTAEIQMPWPALGAYLNYRLNFWYADDGQSHIYYVIRKFSGETLQADGSWGGAPHTFHLPSVGMNWTQQIHDFTSSAADWYRLEFGVANDAGAPLVEAWVDTFSLRQILDAVTCPINFRARIKGWTYPQTWLDYAAEGVQSD